MECIFLTGGRSDLGCGSERLIYSRAELGARQFTGSELKFSKNSSALGEEKSGLKGEDIICLFDYSFHCLDALISC